MDPLGKKELLSFYDRHLRDFGDAPQAVRWTPEGQLRRYETFLKIAGDFRMKKILDFGCGKGDFYRFLSERSIAVHYCGIDVNENLIQLARNKYPEAEFHAMDVDESGLQSEFDLVFACGVFNLRIAGIEESVKDILPKLFQICRESLHINFLTWHVPQRDVELFYVRPEEILEYVISRISRSVTLRHVGEDIFLSVYR